MRELPGLERIEIDPDVIGGRPAIRGRRIPAQLVAELAATPAGREVVAVDYDDLEPEDIRDAERWWAAARGVEQGRVGGRRAACPVARIRRAASGSERDP